MVGTMQELRVATVDRNAEFEEELEAIRTRHAALRAAVAREEADATDAFASMRARMEAAFAAVSADLDASLSAAATAAATHFPPMAAELDRLVAAETRFYAEEVPAKNEAMCGEHVRAMTNHREALSLDNMTIAAREAKVVDRFEAHVAAFDERSRVEREDREAQYAGLTAAFTASVRGWAVAQEPPAHSPRATPCVCSRVCRWRGWMATPASASRV